MSCYKGKEHHIILHIILHRLLLSQLHISYLKYCLPTPKIHLEWSFLTLGSRSEDYLRPLKAEEINPLVGNKSSTPLLGHQSQAITGIQFCQKKANFTEACCQFSQQGSVF